MARKMTEWPSKRGPITKIMPSDGCIGDTVPLAVGKWYDFHEFGWYMGNVGLNAFKKSVDDLIATLKAQPKAPGVDQIFMPGEQSAETFAQRSRDGIPVPSGLWALLNELRS